MSTRISDLRHPMPLPIVAAFTAVILYLASAWLTFQYRNPKANKMTFYREFPAVVTWKALPAYQ